MGLGKGMQVFGVLRTLLSVETEHYDEYHSAYDYKQQPESGNGKATGVVGGWWLVEVVYG